MSKFKDIEDGKFTESKRFLLEQIKNDMYNLVIDVLRDEKNISSIIHSKVMSISSLIEYIENNDNL